MSNNLREIRREQGLSQAKLAFWSGVAARTIWYIEQGTTPRHPAQRRLCIALGIPFSDRQRVFPAQEKQ